MKSAKYFLLTFLLLLPNFALSRSTRFDGDTFLLAPGKNDYVEAIGTKTLSPGQWRFLSMAYYSRQPLKISNAGVVVNEVIGHLLRQDNNVSVGIFPWMEAGLNVPIVWFARTRAPVAPAPASTDSTALGDISLSSKFKILRSNGWGLATQARLILPTGKQSAFLGEDKVSGEITLAADKKISRKVSVGVNAGLLGPHNVSLLDYQTRGALIFKAGVSYKASKNTKLKMDIVSRTALDDPYSAKAISPVSISAAVDQNLGKGWALLAGGGAGINRGAGAPIFRAFAGLRFQPPRKSKAENMEVYFDTNKSRLDSTQRQNIGQFVQRHKKANQNFTVTGHADSRGSGPYNRQLGLSRAESVRTAIGSNNVPPKKIVVQSHGEDTPKADNKTARGRQLNRRVEISVGKKRR